jgi:hypothetical protein
MFFKFTAKILRLLIKVTSLGNPLNHYNLADSYKFSLCNFLFYNKGVIMRKAKNGDTVRVHFTGCFEDGTKFATTTGEKPMELTMGDGKLIGCFEQNLIGMSAGEKKTVRLDPDQAAGERRPELVKMVPRHMVPEQHEDLKVWRQN